jgi:hypothetical protein
MKSLVQEENRKLRLIHEHRSKLADDDIGENHPPPLLASYSLTRILVIAITKASCDDVDGRRDQGPRSLNYVNYQGRREDF